MNPAPSRRRYALPLLALFALALRLIALVEARSVLFFNFPTLDPLEYVTRARAVAAGVIASPSVPFHGEIYPLLMGGLFALASPSFVLLGFVQVTLGLCSAWLAQSIARELGGSLAARLVSFAAIGAGWVFIVYDLQWMPTGLVVLLDLLVAWLVVRSPDGEAGHAWSAAAGAAVGLSAATWGPGLFLLPAAIAGLSSRAGSWRARVLRGVICASACGALLLPFALHNHSVSGRWVITQSNGWMALYIGNNPDADGSPQVRAGREWDLMKRRAGAEGDAWYRREVLRFWAERPGDSLALLGRKLALLLANPEISPSQDPYLFRESSLALSAPLPSSGIVLALGLVGLLCSLRSARARRLVPLILTVAVVPLVFSVCDRYRLPLVALLAPFAGLVVDAFVVREPRRRLQLAGWIGALLAFSLADPAGARERRLFRTELYEAMQLRQLGRLPESDLALLAERGKNESDPEVHFELGVSHKMQGKPAQALAHLQRALDLAPDFWEALVLQAEAKLELGDEAGCLSALGEAKRRAPGDVAVEAEAVQWWIAQGRLELARAFLRLGMDLAPVHPRSRALLTALEAQTGPRPLPSSSGTPGDARR